MMLDTVIIGSGIAGLAAGQCLIENGKDNFLILESSDRNGGRIRTVEFAGNQFSIGPGWLHGRTGNPIFDILNKLGIQMETCQFDEHAFFVWDVKEDKEITEEFVEKTYQLEEMFQDVTDFADDNVMESEKSVFDVLSDKFDVFRHQTDIDRMVLYIMKEVYLGAPLSQVSALVDFQINDVYKSEDEEINLRILDPLGVTKMIDHFVKPLTEKIILNCNVKKIAWDRDNHDATIFCSNGREYRCKNVIITLQSDMLAKGAIEFVPVIPREKITAWSYIPSVDYCRVFAKFPRKFWPSKEWLLYVSENVNPFDELILWQNCQKQNLCSEDDNILICHHTSTKKSRNRLFDYGTDKLRQLVTEAMKKMFPETFCEPDEVMFVSFSNDDGCAGAFSIASPGLDKKMIKALTESVGPLHFAGESVSMELLGTMQAAYVTGRNAAKLTFN